MKIKLSKQQTQQLQQFADKMFMTPQQVVLQAITEYAQRNEMIIKPQTKPVEEIESTEEIIPDELPQEEQKECDHNFSETSTGQMICLRCGATK